jgi:hypothetical protein
MTAVRKIITASALALILSATSASALDQMEKSFVVNAVGSLIITSRCPGYKMTNDGLIRMSDRMGIDGSITKAIVATLGASSDRPYEREDLIPEVTRLVVATADAVSKELPSGCAKWASPLVNNGVIERR